MKNKKNFILSLCFFAGAIFAVIVLLRDGFQTYLITGLVLFTMIGLAFFKRRNDS